jgi:hypothetical protein
LEGEILSQKFTPFKQLTHQSMGFSNDTELRILFVLTTTNDHEQEKNLITFDQRDEESKEREILFCVEIQSLFMIGDIHSF